jgi:crossover junction endodeoxyribonuclease RusA
MITLKLPWPSSALSPNSRKHWAVLAKEKKKYRAKCAYEALAQGVKNIDAKKLHVSIVFHPPTRRAFDLDNLLARMKSGLDGLSDVIGVDDKNWSIHIEKSDNIGGFVDVKIELIDNE